MDKEKYDIWVEFTDKSGSLLERKLEQIITINNNRCSTTCTFYNNYYCDLFEEEIELLNRCKKCIRKIK